jgi:hypothetical protein
MTFALRAAIYHQSGEQTMTTPISRFEQLPVSAIIANYAEDFEVRCTGAYLPAPFQDIRVDYHVSDACVQLVYTGDAERLVSAGVIEEAMAGKGKKGEKPRVDSRGDYFHREVRVRSTPLSKYLCVSRYITDPAYAATLPGAPKVMRFERLDWLDAHPGQLHTRVTNKEQDGGVHTWRSTAGRMEDLVAAGFPVKMIQRFRASEPKKYGWQYNEKNLDSYRLMRGYFAFETWSFAKELPVEPKQELSPQKANHLRLAWSNPNPQLVAK